MKRTASFLFCYSSVFPSEDKMPFQQPKGQFSVYKHLLVVLEMGLIHCSTHVGVQRNAKQIVVDHENSWLLYSCTIWTLFGSI